MKKFISLFLFTCLLYSFSYADPCSGIQQIACGDTVNFSATGFSDPSYPNAIIGQSCNQRGGHGGQESIYRFVVPATGTYQINTIQSNSFYYVDYYYKRNSASFYKVVIIGQNTNEHLTFSKQ